MQDFTLELKRQSAELGFVLSGVTAAAEPGRLKQFQNWLDAGFYGQMHYLPDRRAAYQHPRHVLDGCRTIVMLAMPYNSQATHLTAESAEYGLVARYAHGPRDYHDVIHERLKRLKVWVLDRYPQASVRGVVDTAPLLERELAEAAGLGWVGKNTLLLNRQWGSYFFLAALLTDLELVVDVPLDKGYCGSCTACLEACPTRAFPKPFVLDATRCISYLTIEHRDHLDANLQNPLAGWIFGCDICQEVCPWNRKERVADPACLPAVNSLNLLELLEMTESEFRARFRRTPLWRTKRRGLVRNAILLVGHQQLEEACQALSALLLDDEPMLRAAAAWALSRIQPTGWRQSVATAIETEADPEGLSRMQRLLNETLPNG